MNFSILYNNVQDAASHIHTLSACMYLTAVTSRAVLNKNARKLIRDDREELSPGMDAIRHGKHPSKLPVWSTRQSLQVSYCVVLRCVILFRSRCVAFLCTAWDAVKYVQLAWDLQGYPLMHELDGPTYY